MSSFWSQALCSSARMQVTQTVHRHSRDWKRRRRGRESQCQPSLLPPKGCAPAKLSHNLSASSQCQPRAHSHALPRTWPSPSQEHSPRSGIGQAASSTPKSHLSHPSKLKAVHKRGCHHTSERWSKLFSLIKPISSNESLLLGLNSSEINPKAAKLPTTSSQCSEAAFLLLQTTLGKYYHLQPCSWSRSPGWYIQSKCFPCSCPVTFTESPKCQNHLLREQQQISPEEYPPGQASAHKERLWPWHSFVPFFFYF